MIRRAQDRENVLPLLGDAPFFAAEMLAEWDARGPESFFLVDDGAVLLLRGGFAMLYGTVQDRAELESFLNFQKVSCVQSADWVPTGFEAREQWILRYEAAPENPARKPHGYVLDEEPVLYRAAQTCITKDVTNTPPEEWAAMACVRRNKCGGRMLALKQGEEYAALAGLLAQTEKQAYLAGVVTASAHRGKGCASYLVSCAAREGQARGKKVFLVCESVLRPFYRRLGFVEEQRIFLSRKRSEKTIYDRAVL